MGPIVEIKDLSKSYRVGSSEVHALRSVSLQICPGEFVAIMGPSGSGKSTLLHLLGFLDSPHSGSYLFAGSPTEQLGENQLATIRSRMIGFIFQSFHLLPRATATANVNLPLIYGGFSNRPQKALECLKTVGLENRAHHRPNELSGGQQQRVAVARALVNDPLLILADEPTGNLDGRSRDEILSLLRAIHQTGKTVVVVTHDPEVAQEAHRVIQMRDGRIISDEQTQEPERSAVRPGLARPPQSRTAFGWSGFCEQVRLAFASILSHKLRSGLTMLGVIMGVGSIIAMMMLGDGMEKELVGNMETMGAKMIMVRPGSVSRDGVRDRSGSSAKLTFEDAQDIAARCPSVVRTAPSVTEFGQISHGDRNMNAPVMGVTAENFAIKSVESIQGRYFTRDEDAGRALVAVLQHKAAKNLFAEGEDPVEQEIRINKIGFRVIGVIPEGGQKNVVSSVPDDAVLIPLDTAMKRMFGQTHVDAIEVEAARPDHLTEAQKEIKEVLRYRHKLGEDTEDDFEMFSFVSMLKNLKKGLLAFTLFLASIAAVSLLVGGIGIMNIMLVSVTERTKEIGLRKALGARKADILAQFLTEAVTLCLIGGLIGVGLGILIASGLSMMIHIKPALTLSTALMAFMSSSAVGILFGFWPALQAARLHPIEALRYE